MDLPKRCSGPSTDRVYFDVIILRIITFEMRRFESEYQWRHKSRDGGPQTKYQELSP